MLVLLGTISVLASTPGALLAQAVEQEQAAGQNRAFSLATDRYRQKDWEAAGNAFRAFLRDYPESPRCPSASFYLAESLMQTGDYQGARDEFARFLTRMGGDPQTTTIRSQFRIAEASFLLQESSRAEDELRAFVRAYPEDSLTPTAWYYLGELAFARGDRVEAAACFQRGLTLEPESRTAANCRERIHELESAPPVAVPSNLDRSADRPLEPGRPWTLRQLELHLGSPAPMPPQERAQLTLDCIRGYCQQGQLDRARSIAENYLFQSRMSMQSELDWRRQLVEVYWHAGATSQASCEARRVELLERFRVTNDDSS